MKSNNVSAIDLTDHVALVTGATSGLGKSIAFRLAKAGAKIAINYCYNEKRAQETLAQFQNEGYEAALFKADVTDETSVNTMLAEIKETLGAVDILVPNATCPQPAKPIEEYDWETYQAMIDFFIKSPFLLTKATVTDMKKQQWGRIITIGSDVFQRSVGNFSAYVAAKGGQTGWSRSMSTELAPFGITVNMVTPGWIPNERHVDVPTEVKDAYINQVPAGRWGVPQDIAEAVLYFASEEASFVSGQTLCVNGGLTQS